MPNRHDLTTVQARAAKHGGEVLSGTYLGSTVKHTFRCKEGHVFQLIPRELPKRFCAACGKKRGGTVRNKYSLEDIQALAAAKGGRLLSTSRGEGRTNLEWMCEHGHTWLATRADVQDKGNWCPHCPRKSETLVRKTFEGFFGATFDKCRPQWLRGGKGYPLELDGFNPYLAIAFEYQGPQHYRPVDIWGGEAKLQVQQERDALKRAQCEQAGVELIEIPCLSNVRRVHDPRAIEKLRTSVLRRLNARYGTCRARTQLQCRLLGGMLVRLFASPATRGVLSAETH
ncbi:PDDEXK family nuclease [Ramlibacter alkalitolerans]|uniref:Zinc-ribbon domain-containing protein n=1 Tax=Ramlibacter alkalitolerans TaxID=2039631 RepID=A0ABS1JVF4_9BURK|nr:hypothetical protein [Ramlibacter alkalitolerans]MBL0427846.1 hypothetical protein [Ramlibacter alkalitolerans]